MEGSRSRRTKAPMSGGDVKPKVIHTLALACVRILLRILHADIRNKTNITSNLDDIFFINQYNFIDDLSSSHSYPN